MWKTIGKLSPSSTLNDMPEREEFYEYFKSKSTSNFNSNFDYDIEYEAICHVDYISKNIISPQTHSTEFDILNKNFTEDEISHAIDKLKNNKSPGYDGVIAEFLKSCKDIFTEDLTVFFNYIMEKRKFPDAWADGLRSPIFKSGSRWKCDNYRGVTVLSVFEKVFEIAVLNRLEYFTKF